MGGVLRTLEIGRKAVARGHGLIVGAQVGETSLLSRAGLAVASGLDRNVLGREGAFGTHLLQYDISRQDIRFGQSGMVSVAALAKKPGLGVQVTDESVRQCVGMKVAERKGG